MKKVLFSTALMLCCAVASAGSAPWYKWRSTLSETDVCAQVSPGEGWVKILGPFKDSACRKPGVPQ